MLNKIIINDYMISNGRIQSVHIEDGIVTVKFISAQNGISYETLESPITDVEFINHTITKEERKIINLIFEDETECDPQIEEVKHFKQ